MGRKFLITDERLKSYILQSYINGVRLEEIMRTIREEFELNICERTLYRFIIKNIPVTRYARTHKYGKKGKKNEAENNTSIS